MTKAEVMDELARSGAVEEMVRNVSGRALSAELEDLCQMVYEALLAYPEEKIVGLAERGELRWFAARIVINQYRSTRSEFHKLYRKRQMQARGIDADRGTEDGRE